MRVFIAIDLPSAIQASLAEAQHELRAMCSAARWVAPESIHLTLRFLGEISPIRLEEATEALTGLVWKPFEVHVRGIGFFPGSLSPRVLWAGIAASSLEDLAGEIDARMNRLGFEPEQRAYRPHLTLARAKQSRLDGALTQAAERFKEFDFGSFVADRFALYEYESELQPFGPAYVKLKEYAFVTDGGRT